MKIFSILAAANVFAQDIDDGCGEGEIDLGNGICTDDESVASRIREIQAELAEDESEDRASSLGRRFSMGQVDDFSNSGNMRTKRRTQRLTLLMAKVEGQQRNVGKFRPREFMRRINGYGCHCWTKPNTENIGYKGQPLDGVDRACRTLHSCHTCINLDYNECDPVTTKYRAKVVKNGDGTIDIQCTNTMNAKGTNNGECKRSLCECDKQFSEQVAADWQTWDEGNWNLDGRGLFDAACVTNGARSMSAGPPDQCCGTSYPDMKPFSTDSHTCTDARITPINNL
jgi:hypothetical protein